MIELVELLAKSQDAILDRVDSKLQELKRFISEDQEECLSSVVKRVKEDNSSGSQIWFILEDPGATSRDDAIFSGERHFCRESVF